MQNNASQLERLSPDPAAGLVYTRDEHLGRTIGQEVRPLCRIEAVTASAQDVLRTMETGKIRTGFIHITPETKEDGISLLHHLRRIFPDSKVFVITDEKDPDLILEGMRLGVLDFILPAEKGANRFLPPLQKALGETARQGRNGFIYSFFSLKGGQGNTSLSVNLADQIHSLTNGRVLLLDLNLYMGDVGAMVNVEPGFTPFDLIRDLSRMDENLLLSSLHRHDRGIYVLPSPAVVSDAERVHRNQIADMLVLLKSYFSHIVMDLPNELSERTLAAVEASDRVMVLVEPNLVSIKSAQQVLQFFQELNYGEERVAVVLNRQHHAVDLQPEDIQLALQRPLLCTIAKDEKALVRSAQKGEPLSVNHGRRRVTRDLHQLAARLTGISEERCHRRMFHRWLKNQ